MGDDGMKFSALPYLGFTYGFGAQGSQFLTANYVHAFSDSLLLNLNYSRSSSNGYLRNSSFNHSDLTTALKRRGNFYSFRLDAGYHASNITHPGGVYTDSLGGVLDTLIEDFGLGFSSVSKPDASTAIRLANVELKNYFDFTPSATNSTGLLIATNYEIINRKYVELDTVSGIYPMINVNSDTTNDEYNLASIRNSSGFYFSRSGFYIDAKISHRYWKYSNLGKVADTTEISLTSNLNWNLKKHHIQNYFYFNILGAYNGWRNDVFYAFDHSKVHLNVASSVGNMPLSIFKRKYFANNYDYATNTLTNQFQFYLKASAQMPIKDSIVQLKLEASQLSLAGIYRFDGSIWRNDTLNTAQATALGLSIPIQLGLFNIHPTFRYTFSTNSGIPRIQGYLRMYIKSKLFAGKKLEIATGVDLSYASSYELQLFNVSMGLFDNFNSTGNIVNSRTNAHAFVNLGIREFNFFFRYENISYYWENRLDQIVAGYPFATPRMRIGITWQFFN
jgi:hypothetical protein